MQPLEQTQLFNNKTEKVIYSIDRQITHLKNVINQLSRVRDDLNINLRSYLLSVLENDQNTTEYSIKTIEYYINNLDKLVDKPCNH